jgi:drug/metabolite transporter (DMT)-like permease
MNAPRWRIVVVMSIGVIVISFASVIIRLTPAPSSIIAAGRVTVASLVLAPFFWTRWPQMREELRQVNFGLLLLAGFLMAVHFACWVESLNLTSVASSIVLVATDPILVAALSPLLLRERTSARTWLAVGLGLAGLLVIAGPMLGSARAARGDLLALAGAACSGGYMLVGRKVRPRLSLLAYIYVKYTIAAILLLGLVVGTGQNLLRLAPQAWLLILLLGLGPQLIGHTSFNWALRYLSAPLVAILHLGEPIGATLLAWLILRQAPTGFEVAGAAVIGLGVYLAGTEIMRRKPDGQPT